MQKLIGGLLIGATLILSAICLMQSREIVSLKKEATALRADHAASAAKVEEQQATIKKLQRHETAALSQETQKLVEQNAKLSSSAKATAAAKARGNVAATESSASGENEQGGLGGFYSKMMSDPKMKEMMRQQQKQALKMMYGPLMKDLKLSPDESDKLNALLLDNQMGNMEKAGEIMKAGDKTEAAKSVAKQREDMEGEIKALLGNERFAQYKDYTESMPDRMMLEQFKGQSGDSPLRDDQTKALLQIMREERKNSPMPDFSKAENFSVLNDADATEKLFEYQEQINQRVRERAASLLTQEQLDSLGSFQTNQLEMQKMGMTMAKTMFGGKTNKTEP